MIRRPRRVLNGHCDALNAFGGRLGDGENSFAFAFGFVDLLLALGLGSLDHHLFLAFRLIDGGVANGFGG